MNRKTIAAIGAVGLIAAFVIEIIDAGIVGWVLWYLLKALVGGFAGVTAESAAADFDAMLGNTGGMLFWITPTVRPR